ncbi:unnamed protein product, partial [Polarella glacialis]
APVDISCEDLELLEREAAIAGEQLRKDNLLLKETADKLKSKYNNLLKESKSLERSMAAQAPHEDELMGMSLGVQTPTFKNLACMQDEVAGLAMENASLVDELARLRESIESARDELGLLPPPSSRLDQTMS